MNIKPQRKNYIPLFEDYKSIVEKLVSLPDKMKSDIEAMHSLDKNAILCGQLAMYLHGEHSELPESVDMIVSDARKIFECGPCDDNLDYPPNEDVFAQDEEEKEGENKEIEGMPGEIVVITVNPEGEVESIAPDERPDGDYDEEGNYYYESLGWLNVNPEGVSDKCNIFETKKSIETMPIEVGEMTILVEVPGVGAEYRKKFAKIKDKVEKAKFDKSSGHDSSKQKHAAKGSDMQDAPKK